MEQIEITVRVKEKMFKEIHKFGIETTDEMDVKKAKELVYNKINNKFIA